MNRSFNPKVRLPPRPKPQVNWLFTYKNLTTSKDPVVYVFWRKSVGDQMRQVQWFAKNCPQYQLLKVELDWVGPIVREVRKEGGEAWDNLSASCNLNQRTAYSLVLEYGDPRKWREAHV